MQGQEEYLDLNEPKIQKDIAKLDWQVINKLMGKKTHKLSLDATFFKAVCNEKSCPDGWESKCRKDYQNCKYYNILDAVLAKKGG